eukprot:CAMPEP_0185750214 /NCGR_PEP_ID=MMETSP1174-20130828/8964_1 /TAXON_ID=35687 /ORGANISM="Dictyocha speculum, Strain CCMP1381" /LENGTH=180 /DNA_ID=CAMNT_0028426663 /DNA_START=9 /DNA_END=547 /DNA_ORIENTATION=-
MASLYKLATGEEQGEYSVGECNCHHMAQLLFNRCATDAAVNKRVVAIPNSWLSGMARGLSRLGVDVAGSNTTSGSIASTCGFTPSEAIQLNSSSASFSRVAHKNITGVYPIVHNCPEESHKYAALTAKLSQWIYMPHPSELLVTNCISDVVELIIKKDGEKILTKRLEPLETVRVEVKTG